MCIERFLKETHLFVIFMNQFLIMQLIYYSIIRKIELTLTSTTLKHIEEKKNITKVVSLHFSISMLVNHSLNHIFLFHLFHISFAIFFFNSKIN